MEFHNALRNALAGRRVRRPRWAEAGRWMQHGLYSHLDERFLDCRDPGGSIEYVPTPSDMVATDWEVMG